MFEKMRERREKKNREAKDRLEEKLRLDREKLMSIYEKELLVEAILELRKINEPCKDISSQSDEISMRIPLYNG